MKKNSKNVSKEANKKDELNNSSVLPIIEKISNPSEIDDKKFQKFYNYFSELKMQIISIREQCFAQRDELSQKQLHKTQAKFNDKISKINKIAIELNLSDSFLEQEIDLVNGRNVENAITENISVISNQHKSQTIENVNFNSDNSTIDDSVFSQILGDSPMDVMSSAFGKESSTSINPKIENLHNKFSSSASNSEEGNIDDTNIDFANDSFIAPVTRVVENPSNVEKNKRAIRDKLLNAIKMDYDSLPETNQKPNMDEYGLPEEFGLHVETKSAQYSKSTLKEIVENKENTSDNFNVPGGQKKVVEEEHIQFEIPKFDASATKEEEDLSYNHHKFDKKINENIDSPANDNFVAPVTRVVKAVDMQDHMKNILAKKLLEAVRMEWSSIPETNQAPNMDEYGLPEEFGLHVETKSAQYSKSALNAIKQESNSEVITDNLPSSSMSFKHSNETSSGINIIKDEHNIIETKYSLGEILKEFNNISKTTGNVMNDERIEQIDIRLRSIEDMINQLANNRNVVGNVQLKSKISGSTTDQQINSLINEFEKISYKLEKITNNSEEPTKPNNLFGSLTRGYKYNSKH